VQVGVNNTIKYCYSLLRCTRISWEIDKVAMIFGEKTVAWFDVWSLEHFVAGMSLTMVVMWFMERNGYDEQHKIVFYALVVAVSCAWEMLEHYLEVGIIGTAWLTHWFQGVEFWGNRLITDPLLVVLGSTIALKYRQIIVPARLFSITWILTHLFYFPDSMYLHRFL
jgi:hypothetical protein